jgi:predicted HTH domain antitoxin
MLRVTIAKLTMHQFLEPINLEISPTSLRQGEPAIRQTLALQLYAQEVFTFGQARRLAGLSVWEFQQLLAQNNIQRHYSEIELAEDADAIETSTYIAHLRYVEAVEACPIFL